MRVFVALDIPNEVRSAIAALVAKMRAMLPKARWVRIEGAHVTLKFIGEVPQEKVESIQTALRTIALPAPVRVVYRGLGFFPNEKRPRLFWAGIEAGADMPALVAEVERVLEPLGIARESRAFSPHLTLARLENPGRLDVLREFIAASGPLEFGSAACSEFYLYRSVLKRGGAEYTRLASNPFVRSGGG